MMAKTLEILPNFSSRSFLISRYGLSAKLNCSIVEHQQYLLLGCGHYLVLLVLVHVGIHVISL